MSEEPKHSLPATSTMALSLHDVQQRLPAGVTLERIAGGHELSVRLRMTKPALGLLGGAVLWVLYGLATEPVVMVPSIALVYLALGFLIDRRTLLIEADRVRVRSHPLPMVGDRTIRIEKIDHIEVITVGKRSGNISYRIDVVTKGREHKAVVQDLESEEQALVIARYLAQELHLPL